MSTRWYPIYQKGNPQLRVFLPNFFMKLVQPHVPAVSPPNKVQFVVSNGMSSFDVKEYLEKIYSVPVVHVRMFNQQGRFRRVQRKGYIVKDDDFRVALVTLPKDVKFEFPNIFPKDKIDKDIESEQRNMDQLKTSYKEYLQRNKLRPDVPGWFL